MFVYASKALLYVRYLQCLALCYALGMDVPLGIRAALLAMPG